MRSSEPAEGLGEGEPSAEHLLRFPKGGFVASTLFLSDRKFLFFVLVMQDGSPTCCFMLSVAVAARSGSCRGRRAKCWSSTWLAGPLTPAGSWVGNRVAETFFFFLQI